MKLSLWICSHCTVATLTVGETLDYCSHCGRDDQQTVITKAGYIEVPFSFVDPLEQEETEDA